MTIDLQHVDDALDARSEDYAKVVIIDRVQLAPAWRGLGGVGRLLTARLLRWVCNDPRLVAVLPFPIDLDRALRKDNSAFEPALSKYAAPGQRARIPPHHQPTVDHGPADGTHENAVIQLEKAFNL
ncbi:hypothetical protein [Amycolatopsis orientalis]|uniref:hypothetical protein n=1 Tax=Amycolatopsis orientalis TaxID=31958 RepID=UPI0003FB5D21|nr:hypothetical protein [Amycolatopsis orientalis]